MIATTFYTHATKRIFVVRHRCGMGRATASMPASATCCCWPAAARLLYAGSPGGFASCSMSARRCALQLICLSSLLDARTVAVLLWDIAA